MYQACGGSNSGPDADRSPPRDHRTSQLRSSLRWLPGPVPLRSEEDQFRPLRRELLELYTPRHIPGYLSIPGSGLPETFDRFVDDLPQFLEPLVHGAL